MASRSTQISQDGSNIARPSQVFAKDGLLGAVVRDDVGNDGKGYVIVGLGNNEQVRIPVHLLTIEADGQYHIASDRTSLWQSNTALAADGTTIVVPVIAERLELGKRIVEMGKVRLQKLVHTREEVVDEPLLYEEIQVERIERNQMVDSSLPVRYEDDVMIVPVYEEVLVVEKRLFLKEELRITKRQATRHEPQTVTLREEQVVVERSDAASIPEDKPSHI